MSHTKFLWLIAVVILLIVCLKVSEGAVAASSSRLPITITSPNQTIELTFGLKTFAPATTSKRPYYHVKYRGTTLVADSPLGMALANAPPLDRNFIVKDITRQSMRHTWRPVIGKSSLVQVRGEQLKVSLQERYVPYRRLNILLRANDDGIAFRYELPPQPHLSHLQITAEKSEFRFAGNYTVWALPPGFHTYEGEYSRKTLAELPTNNLQALPLLMSAGDDKWMALAEADLTNYAGMYVSRLPEVFHTLVTALPNQRQPVVKVESQTLHSPWRVLMIGQTPGALIESNLILNLSRPSAIADPSWIKPGKAAWNWWSDNVVTDPKFLVAGNKPGMNTATMKHYIDFAARMGFEYSVIDAGWYRSLEPPYDKGDITQPNEPTVNLPEILAHAKTKNVKVILWVHSRLADQQMNQAFPLYEQWGVAGVKIDFIDSDEQPQVEFYERALKLAAKHHLVVDFHGAFKPTGLDRTWPNELTREALLGLEHAKWSQNPNPEHNVTLPFTRMLTGSMDYTPGGFTNANGQNYQPQFEHPIVAGTRCHQLAMYVVYQSGLAMVSDFPENILGQVGADFLRHVPTTWDQTRVLNGVPGDYITIARQRGREWYLGAMTDNTGRSLVIPLNFLSRGRYVAEIYADDPQGLNGAAKIAFHRSTVTAQDTLTANLAPGGGFAVRFYPN